MTGEDNWWSFVTTIGEPRFSFLLDSGSTWWMEIVYISLVACFIGLAFLGFS